MKKIKSIILLFLIMITLTGCIKLETTMDIKKDKSMNFEIIMAVQNGLEDEMDSDEDAIKEFEKAGFKVEEYSKEGKTGYKISKEIKNIDEISIDSPTTFNLGEFLKDENLNLNSVFEIKKGFLKNTYKAKVKYEGNMDENDDTLDSMDSDNMNVNTIDPDNINVDASVDLSGLEDMDYSELADALDMTFNVKLPYAVISSNATNITDENKSLSWNLVSNQIDGKDCEFEFYLYNLKTIYLLVGSGVVAILLVLACSATLISNKIKVNKLKKNGVITPEGVYIPNANVNTPTNTEPANVEPPVQDNGMVQNNNMVDNNTMQNNGNNLNNMMMSNNNMNNQPVNNGMNPNQQQMPAQEEKIENYFNVGALQPNITNGMTPNNTNNNNGFDNQNNTSSFFDANGGNNNNQNNNM